MSGGCSGVAGLDTCLLAVAFLPNRSSNARAPLSLQTHVLLRCLLHVLVLFSCAHGNYYISLLA